MIKYYDFPISDEVCNMIKKEMNERDNERIYTRSLEMNAVDCIEDDEGIEVSYIDEDGLYLIGNKCIIEKDQIDFYSFYIN